LTGGTDRDWDTGDDYVIQGVWVSTDYFYGGQLIKNGGAIVDANKNEQIVFNTTGSAITYFTVTNATTGNGPTLSSAGETNVDLNIDSAGTGEIVIGSADAKFSVTSDSTNITNTGAATFAGVITGQAGYAGIGDITMGDADPALTCNDTTASQPGTCGIYSDAVTAGQDSSIVLHVDAGGVEDVPYLTLDGTNEVVALGTSSVDAKPFVIVMGNQADDPSFAISMSADGNGDVTFTSTNGDAPDLVLSGFNSFSNGTVTFTGGAVTGLTTIAASGVVSLTNATEASAIGTAAITVAGGASVAKDIWVGDDIVLDSDVAKITFGDSNEIQIIHSHNEGLDLFHVTDADNTPFILELQTNDSDINADVIGAINFRAPNAGADDAILVAAGIEAVAEGAFGSASNATKLSFKTGASEVAAEKMALSSAGILSVTGGITSTGTVDLGGATTEIWNSTSDMALTVAGQIGLQLTDDQLVFHGGAAGEIQGEAAHSLLQHFAISFDPKVVCDGAVDRLFLMTIGDDAPEGIIITEWKLSFEADPTTEVDLDFKRADAFIGVANAAVIDALDTTNGVSTEDTNANINGGAAVANGKVLYLEFGTAYTETTHQIIFEFWYYAEED